MPSEIDQGDERPRSRWTAALSVLVGLLVLGTSLGYLAVRDKDGERERRAVEFARDSSNRIGKIASACSMSLEEVEAAHNPVLNPALSADPNNPGGDAIAGASAAGAIVEAALASSLERIKADPGYCNQLRYRVNLP